MKKRIKFSIGSIIVLLQLNGCSMMIKDRPPEKDMWNAAHPSIECSTSNGWPVFDTGYGFLNGIAGLSLGLSIAPVLAFNGLLIYSGIDGFSKTKECKEFKNFKYKKIENDKKIQNKLYEKTLESERK